MVRPPLLAVAGMPALPATNGYALRVSNLLREIARSWRVTLVVPLGASSARELGTLGVQRVVPTTLFGEWGAPIGSAKRRALRDLMDRVIDEETPQVALVWACAEDALLDHPRFPPTVLDWLDSQVVSSWRELRRATGVRNHLRALRDIVVSAARERRVVRTAAATVVDNETDARVLRWVAGRETVHVVSNGVAIQPQATDEEETATPTVVFTGNMSYPPNVRAVTWFVQSVWPAVRAVVPTALFVVAGWHPAPEILALDARPGVSIMADLHDLSPVLRGAWLAAAPLMTGAGLRTKILEAWAVGRPVVLSPVAASGLHLDDDAASLVVRDASGAAQVIEHLLKDGRERHRLGADAHALAEREYVWERAGSRLNDLLCTVARRSPGDSRQPGIG